MKAPPPLEPNLLLQQALSPANRSSPARFGWWVLMLGLGSFLLWAAIAPLANGVAIPGIVTVSGERQSVQTLNGGVVAALRVREGQLVAPGQLLVELDPTPTRSQAEDLRVQLAAALACQARLLAERDGTALAMPHSPLPGLDLAAPLASERILLDSRQQALNSELAALQLSQQGQRKLARSLNIAYDDQREQRNLLQTQLEHISALAKDGYVPRNRLLSLQRNRAQLDGQLASTKGQMQQADATQSELGFRLAARRASFQQQVRSDLVATQRQLKQLTAQLTAADYALDHTAIRAPVEGRVMGLAIHTIGGVVKSGQPLLQIVPSDVPLMVQAKLPTDKIDKIHSGLPVELVFTAFDRSRTPRLHGKVKLVSPDRFDHENQRSAAFYRVEVEVDPHQLERVGPHAALLPGMPVQVFIRLGQRSLLNYLFKPLLDRMHLAWGEA